MNSGPTQVWQSLNNQWPESGQEDLRGFEWHYLWAQGRALVQLQGHNHDVEKVRFSADGRRFFLGGYRCGKVLGRRHRTIADLSDPGHGQACRDLSGGASCRYFAVAKDNSTELRFWDARTGMRLAARTFPSNEVRHVALHPEGQKIAFSSSDEHNGTVRIWDPATGQVTLLWQKTTRAPLGP